MTLILATTEISWAGIISDNGKKIKFGFTEIMFLLNNPNVVVICLLR